MEHTWPLDRTQTRSSWTRLDDEAPEWTNHVSDSQSCPWWRQQTSWWSAKTIVLNVLTKWGEIFKEKLKKWLLKDVFRPGRHTAWRSWWNKQWRSCCRSWTPLLVRSRTLGRSVYLEDWRAWSPATPHLWHTCACTHSVKNQKQQKKPVQKQSWPEEQEDSLWKSLEVVVPVDLSVILHRNFPKRLMSREGQNHFNFLLNQTEGNIYETYRWCVLLNKVRSPWRKTFPQRN